MRSTLIRLANPARYLTPGNPTGLCGVATHPSPRPVLLNLYQTTLQQLSALPAHSSYRASTEALTKHRLAIIQSYKPEGYDAWLKKSEEKFSEDVKKTRDAGREWAPEATLRPAVDNEGLEWDGEFFKEAMPEGPRERKEWLAARKRRDDAEERQRAAAMHQFDVEPMLEATQ